MNFGTEYKEVKCLSYPYKYGRFILITGEVHLDHLVKELPARILQSNITIFPFLYSSH